MDSRIQELIDFTRVKYGLDHYYLQRYSLFRKLDIFNGTVYTLCMEWFPNHITEHEEDTHNPEGAAVIEMDVNSRKIERAIFVGGKSFANGISFRCQDTNAIIKWIERETGLIYGEQFQLHNEGEGELHFKECYQGIEVSPSGSIEIKYEQDGNLILFAVHGQFPSENMVNEETYRLSLEKVEHLAKEQLKLIEFPSFEQKKIYPVFAVEEIYITNEGTSTIPFEIIVDRRSYLKMDKEIYWDDPADEPFERKVINWNEDVTVEQALSNEPSPDSLPIAKGEQEKCVMTVQDFLSREYPNDSGKWILKTLHRDKGYINGILMENYQTNRVFQRKINIMIEAKSLEIVNYIDNKIMLELFDQYQVSDKVTVTKKVAYEKLRNLFELKPYYVYDFEQKRYVLCGKLDCQYGVNAENGEVIELGDL